MDLELSDWLKALLLFSDCCDRDETDILIFARFLLHQGLTFPVFLECTEAEVTTYINEMKTDNTEIDLELFSHLCEILFLIWFQEGDPSIFQIVHALDSLNVLTLTNVPSNKDCERFIYLIKNAPKLKTVNFKFLDHLSFVNLKNICTAIAQSASVNEIIFEQTDLSADHGSLVMEICLRETFIPRLTVHSCCLDDQGAKAIANVLETNLTLTELDLANNNITSDGVRYLAQALTKNKSLAKLDLGLNEKIKDEGAEALAKFCAKNSTMTHLSLQHTSLTEKGAFSFRKLICDKENSLVYVNMECNWISVPKTLGRK